MRRVTFAFLAAMTLLFGLATAAGAQDLDCVDFGGDQGAAQDYFDQNGGSPSNNVDNLDADNDGIPCEGLGGGGGSSDDGGATDDTASEDVSATDDTGSEAADDTTELPDTGTGPAVDEHVNTSVLMFATIAAFLALAGFRLSRHG